MKKKFFLVSLVSIFFTQLSLGSDEMMRLKLLKEMKSSVNLGEDCSSNLSLQEKASKFIGFLESGEINIENQKADLIIQNTNTGLNRTEEERLNDHDTLGLIPGTIYFYYGASGFGLAQHYGLYLGKGWILEKYVRNEKGVIGINRIETFRSEAEKVRNLRSCFRKTNNNARELHPSKKDRWSKKELIDLLTSILNEKKLKSLSEYNLMHSNCWHFIDSKAHKSETKKKNFCEELASVLIGKIFKK